MKEEYETLKKNCIVCRCNIRPKIRISDGKILSKHFYTKLDKNYFDGWVYEPVDNSFNKFRACHFKNNFYRVIGFCKVMREVTYWFWKLFHRRKVEYWECYNCGGRHI
ncbi:MAG: hypothetical protein ISS25_01605 [Nanoarchaeota archaeon]|nr:hypothetical protein [DPANN group archaeon]MBL7116506.1 hypothetical protein [Nanoarchaeota archaeon]